MVVARSVIVTRDLPNWQVGASSKISPFVASRCMLYETFGLCNSVLMTLYRESVSDCSVVRSEVFDFFSSLISCRP